MVAERVSTESRPSREGAGVFGLSATPQRLEFLEAVLMGNLVTVVYEYHGKAPTPSVRQDYKDALAFVMKQFVDDLQPEELAYFEQSVVGRGGSTPRIQVVREQGIALGKSMLVQDRVDRARQASREEHRRRSRTTAQRRGDTLDDIVARSKKGR